MVMLAKGAQGGGTGLTYKDAGVDIEEGNAFVEALKPIAKRTSRIGSLGGLGGFGGLFDIKATGYTDPVLVAATDGVGTKLKIAIDTGIHHSIGIDLVAMCVNDLIVQGAEPLFFLDYFSCGKLERNTALTVVKGIADGCIEAGAALIGGETAEMPGIYSGKDYDLAGTAIGAVERDDLLPRKDLCSGDVVIGLTSSGVHSNGFSLIREIFNRSQVKWSDRAPFTDDMTLGEALLTPTRIYVKSLLSVIRKTKAVKALAHITGSGPIQNIPRVLPEGLTATIDLGAWKTPPVFHWLSNIGKIEEKELLHTFNCGIGMVVIVSQSDGDLVINALSEHGEEATVIGNLKKGNGNKEAEFVGELKFD